MSKVCGHPWMILGGRELRGARRSQWARLGRWVAVAEEVLEAFLVGEIPREVVAGKCHQFVDVECMHGDRSLLPIPNVQPWFSRVEGDFVWIGASELAHRAAVDSVPQLGRLVPGGGGNDRPIR